MPDRRVVSRPIGPAEVPMGIVDAHHHVWDLAVREQDWISGEDLAPLRRDFTLADLEPVARKVGVEATILVQTVTVVEETAELLALAAGHHHPGGHAFVAGVVGWVDLTAPDVADVIAELREFPGGERLVGIRHQVQHEPDPDWLSRPDVRRGLAAVATAGLVYDLIVHDRQLPAAVAAVRDLPDLRFVLDHLGKPRIAAGEREPWTADLRALAELPNLAGKFSGLATEANWKAWTAADLRPYVDTALEAFGPDRLMFGSDWPVCLLAATYDQVYRAAVELLGELSDVETTAVFSTTARTVYGLPSE